MMSDEELQSCPVCHLVSTTPDGQLANLVAVRTASAYGLVVEVDGVRTGLSDFGYRCSHCGHEWGFEVLTDEAIAAARGGGQQS